MDEVAQSVGLQVTDPACDDAGRAGHEETAVADLASDSGRLLRKQCCGVGEALQLGSIHEEKRCQLVVGRDDQVGDRNTIQRAASDFQKSVAGRSGRWNGRGALERATRDLTQLIQGCG